MFKSWPLFIVAVTLTLTSNQLALLGPKYSGEAIDAIASENGVNFTLVNENIIKMTVCYVLSAILSYILAVVMINISQRVVYRM